MSIEVQMLGEFSIRADGQRLGSLESTRIQCLIAYLALHPHSPSSRSHLAAVLWPDSMEAQAHTNLRKCIHRLKHTIPANLELVRADTNFIELCQQDVGIDIWEFESFLNQAEQARGMNLLETEQGALENAVMIYSGALLPDCYDDWIVVEREALQNRYIHSLERLVALLENRLYYRDAIRYAEQLLKHDPLHESTYQQLIRLYALSGDRATALHVYHTCVATLQSELGVDPAPETREIYERILHAEEGHLILKTTVLPNKARLIGREMEWKQLQSAWRTCLNGEHGFIVLSGEAGIGKTRLAEEFMEWAEHQGILTAKATCYEAEGALAYEPIADWLRAHPLLRLDGKWLSEVARVVPEVLEQTPGLHPPVPMTESWQRQYLFKALSKALSRRGTPQIFLLDNLQWCDRDTLEWLHYFLRDHPPESPLMILATSRGDEIIEQRPVLTLLESLAEEKRLLQIEIPRLNPDQTALLIQDINGDKVSTETSATIYHETEGVPLFIIEIMRSQQGSNKTLPVFDSSGGTKSFSPKILSVISRRLDRLTAPAREAVESASVIGRAFSLELLKQTSQLDEFLLVQTVDELCRRHIIREHGSMYDFTHDKIRETAYQNISIVRRKWLHRMVAQSLERNSQQTSFDTSAQIAGHLEQAGLNERAAQYYFRAARFARQLFANQDALNYIERAIAVNPDDVQAAGYFEEQGDLLTFLQMRERAEQAYQNALQSTAGDDWLRKTRLYRKYAELLGRADVVVAEQSLVSANNMLEHIPVRNSDYWHEWIELSLVKGQIEYWKWNHEEMTRLLDLSAEAIEKYGTPKQKMDYLHRIIMRDNLRERFRAGPKTIQTAQRLLELTAASGNINETGHAHFTLGLALFMNDALAEANGHFQTTLDVAHQTGDQNLKVMCLAYSSLNLRRQGQFEDTFKFNNELAGALGKASISDYEGIVRANRAWLAYCAGKLKEAHVQAQEAIEIWNTKKIPYVMQWTSLIVLLALATRQGNQVDAGNIIEKLLSRPQMLLKPEVDEMLRAALQAIRQDLHPSMLLCEQAVEEARRAGYL